MRAYSIVSSALLLLGGMVLSACSGASGEQPTVSPSPCDYPDGVADPMAFGETIPPFAWPEARHADGRNLPLRLADAPCNTDPDRDFGPFDVLLLVSIPAW